MNRDGHWPGHVGQIVVIRQWPVEESPRVQQAVGEVVRAESAAQAPLKAPNAEKVERTALGGSGMDGKPHVLPDHVVLADLHRADAESCQGRSLTRPPRAARGGHGHSGT